MRDDRGAGSPPVPRCLASTALPPGPLPRVVLSIKIDLSILRLSYYRRSSLRFFAEAADSTTG